MKKVKIRSVKLINKAFVICIFVALLPCCTKQKVMIERPKLHVPDLIYEQETLKLYDIKFKIENDKLILDKIETNKLMKNINTVRVAYFNTVDNYKLAIKNFNDLKKIAYE